jgi:sulfotransferase
MKKIYFLSGLPRSGSTVLAALLQQHPEMHTTATSGLLDMLVGTLKAWADSLSQKSSTKDKAAQEKEIQRILKSICETKYADIDKPVILDKARGLGV